MTWSLQRCVGNKQETLKKRHKAFTAFTGTKFAFGKEQRLTVVKVSMRQKTSTKKQKRNVNVTSPSPKRNLTSLLSKSKAFKLSKKREY